MDNQPKNWIDEQNARLGLVLGPKAWCPICNQIYTTYGKVGEEVALGLFTSMDKLRSTCGSPACLEAETRRVLAPKINQALKRYEEARATARQKEEDAAQSKRETKLKRLGEL